MSDSAEYTIDCASTKDTAVLRGVLRLQSTEAYEKPFDPIRQALRATVSAYTIDLRDVSARGSGSSTPSSGWR